VSALGRTLICAWVLYSLTPGYLDWESVNGFDTSTECKAALASKYAGATAANGPRKGEFLRFKCLPVGVRP
jgi:hypothetical protein